MKTAIAILVVLLLILGIVFVLGRRGRRVIATPGPPPRHLVERLEGDVRALCANGQRNVFVPENLAAAAEFIERELAAAGYRVERQRFAVRQQDTHAENLIVEIHGREHAREVVVIGAHYDSVIDSPGADDNATGVAALLALARRFARETPSRTLRFVAFANEEPPHFQTPDMGSFQYAKRCNERGDVIRAMLSLESLGYFRDEPGSQQYPPPLAALYPNRGDFIGFVGNLRSRALVHESVRAFRRNTALPAEAAVLPELIPQAGWSDQWSFWQFGWPAVMVTDTAPFRNPHYHTQSDLPGTIDYARLAHAVEGLEGTVRALAW